VERLLGGNVKLPASPQRRSLAEMPELHHNLPCLIGMGPAYKVFFKPASRLYSRKTCTRGLPDRQSVIAASMYSHVACTLKRPAASALLLLERPHVQRP